MKIVLAEKVSPTTLAVFAGEDGRQVVTHNRNKEGAGGGIERRRCAGSWFPPCRWTKRLCSGLRKSTG